MHIDAALTPFVSNPVNFLTVDVKSTLTGKFVTSSLCEVDCEIPVPMRKGIGVIMEGHLEARPLEPGDRSSDVSHSEDRFKPSDDPRSGHELQLTVPLTVEAAKAVVTDWQLGVRAESDPPIDRF
jgi:hypothetical protein